VSFAVFTAEDVDGVGGKGLGYTTTVDVQPSLNMSLKPACFIDDAFFWQKRKLTVFASQSSSVRLLGFPNYWMSN
jgi:hypothetical protein